MGLYYIASEENVNYLAHHGIKGQRWGRRKRREDYSSDARYQRAKKQSTKYKVASAMTGAGLSKKKKNLRRGLIIGGAAATGAAMLAYKHRDKIKAAIEKTKGHGQFSQFLRRKLNPSEFGYGSYRVL
jgi:hypothetical protein